MSIAITALMCHAPVVIPPVGGPQSTGCATTTRSMTRVAERIVAARPDVVVVISPHAARALDAWRVIDGGRIRGNFADFSAPTTKVDLPTAAAARSRLARLGAQYGTPTAPLPAIPLDQGAAVPLWFLQRAGWAGATLILALPWREGTEAIMGEALRAASGNERWAIVASGDMSHKLRPGAPAGFHPRAEAFDQAVVAALRAGDLRAVAEVDPELRKLAAEDVVAPVTVAAGASAWRSDNAEVYSYEGPFGVGYCPAVLFADRSLLTPMPAPRS
ncbi:MAG: class III extradiol dioxygenase subunit B-like domain-containing protein [Myxococcota bacterium]